MRRYRDWTDRQTGDLRRRSHPDSSKFTGQVQRSLPCCVWQTWVRLVLQEHLWLETHTHTHMQRPDTHTDTCRDHTHIHAETRHTHTDTHAETTYTYMQRPDAHTHTQRNRITSWLIACCWWLPLTFKYLNIIYCTMHKPPESHLHHVTHSFCSFIFLFILIFLYCYSCFYIHFIF